MTLYDIKPQFQKLLRPFVARLYSRGVTANQVTLLAMVSSLLLGGLLICLPYTSLFALLPVFLFFRMALNAIDGMLAREFNQQSVMGAVLNEVGDIVSDAGLYLAFAFLAGVSPVVVVLVVLLSWLTEFCGVLAQVLTGVRNYRGPLGKSDRAFFFGAIGLGVAIWPEYIQWVNYALILAAVLLVWTCINRSRSAMEVPHA
ncbi:CDP-alcohol phosphatidyltransferase family protein [Mangrovibacter yixingensis]|uniref:CDP-alcohol phosphatidyltransferase family protein n=1 Tax=Mangrovibacter yixingensis TaxID=1529639 RepID=UPI001CFEDC46|nr:CDP-alcohol phosphatidyltransferase family protein [Mangrovibacter yixingensis]